MTMQNVMRRKIEWSLRWMPPERKIEYFTEHKKELPVLERSLIFRVIEDGLQGRDHLGSLLTVMLLSIEVNVIFGDAIVTQAFQIAALVQPLYQDYSYVKNHTDEFHPEYLAKAWMEYTPKKILGIKQEMAYTVWISEEESLPMSNQQKLSYGIKDEDFQMQENGDIMIQYLPHTKTILNIREFDPLEEAVESET